MPLYPVYVVLGIHGTQGLGYARQTLYQTNYNPNPCFCFIAPSALVLLFQRLDKLLTGTHQIFSLSAPLLPTLALGKWCSPFRTPRKRTLLTTRWGKLCSGFRSWVVEYWPFLSIYLSPVHLSLLPLNLTSRWMHRRGKKIGNEFICRHWPMFHHVEESVSRGKWHYPDGIICTSVIAVRTASLHWEDDGGADSPHQACTRVMRLRLVPLSSPCRSICWANSYLVLCGCLQQWSWNYIAVLKEGKPISHILREFMTSVPIASRFHGLKNYSESV